MTMEASAGEGGASDAGTDAGLDSTDDGSEVTEGEGEGDPETDPSAPAQRFKVKADGEEEEVDLPTLLKRYELSKASHKRMEEAARLRKEAEEQAAQMKALLAAAKEDPSHIFKALGIDQRPWAEKYLTGELEYEMLSPEEKELRELRAFKEKQETESKKNEEESNKKRQEELTQQAAVEIESEVVDALKASGLKPTPRTVARVAEIILASLEGEGPRMKATDALQRIQGDYRSDVADYLESMAPETLESEYPSLYKKILEHSAKKQAPVPAFQRGVGNKAGAQNASRKPKTWDDWLKD